MDVHLLQILLRRTRELGMTRRQVGKACWKRGRCKRLEDLSDEYAVELAGKMKTLIVQKNKAAVSMGQPDQTPSNMLAKGEANGPPVTDHYAVNPVTGEEIDIRDIDQVIEESLQASQLLAKLRSFDQLLRGQAIKLAAGNGQIRRLQGQRLSAVLENCGGIHPDMPTLRLAWESYPHFRDRFLRISTVALKLEPFNQLSTLETDDPAYQEFIGLLRRAVDEGQPSLPLLKVN